MIGFGNQDTSYEDYIKLSYPDIVKLNCNTGYGYFTCKPAPAPYLHIFKPEWLIENIKFYHELLVNADLLYDDGEWYEGENESEQFGVADDMKTWRMSWSDYEFERYEWISEDDSDCFMHLIPCGLCGLENKGYGSFAVAPLMTKKRLRNSITPPASMMLPSASPLAGRLSERLGGSRGLVRNGQL